MKSSWLDDCADHGHRLRVELLHKNACVWVSLIAQIPGLNIACKFTFGLARSTNAFVHQRHFYQTSPVNTYDMARKLRSIEHANFQNVARTDSILVIVCCQPRGIYLFRLTRR